MTTHPAVRPDPAPGTAAGTRPPRARRTRWLLGLVAALAVAALLGAVLWAVSRPVPTLDRNTPQGTVQAYVAAVLDGDTAAAAAFLAAGGTCDAADLDRIPVPRSTSVELLGTQEQGTTALVRLRVGTDTGDPLAGTPGEEHVIRLTRGSAGWRIDGVPWPLFDCTGG